MASVTIDGTEYNVDNISERGKEQLASLQFVQAELKKLEAQINIYRTAQSAYSVALKNELGD